MKLHRLAAGLLLAACQGAHAQTEDVFLCVDEQGRKEYKNTGQTKGCRKMDLPGLTTVPGPKRQPQPAQASAKPASTPSDFPKVDQSAQKARDNDRRKILQDELDAEEAKLAELKKGYAGGAPERRGDEVNFAKYQERVNLMKDNITRTEKNIEALRRELSNIK